MAKKQNPEQQLNVVEVLRQHARALEAAVAQTIGAADEKSVHKLRTGTRRVEALLELVTLLQLDGELKTGKLRKLLGEVRRAAGKVRDLDVQSASINAAVEADEGKIVSEATKLLARLKRRRVVRGKALIDDLEGHASKLGVRLEDALKHLKAAEGVTLDTPRLSALVQEWYDAHRGPALDEDGLHDARKAAKLARYLAESIPGSSSMAAEFEAIQEAGGLWHDNLTLAQLASDRLGKKSELARLFAAREAAALESYRRKLGVSG